MYLTLFWFGVLPLLFVVDAVPHRSFTPVKSRGTSRGTSSWTDMRKAPEKVEVQAEEINEAENIDKIIGIKSSTEQRGSNLGIPRVNRFQTQRPLGSKTVTKKLFGRPRLPVRKYSSLLSSESIQMLQQPKCHMPWINELSKIQFYWDGINALCDLAMTFEPCYSSGSVCRRHPVEFTCCPSTSLAVLKKCYKGVPPPDNVCLPTKVNMSGVPKRPKVRRKRPLIATRRIGRTRPVSQQVMESPVAGCTAECSPAWIDMFSNTKSVQNESLPVCEFQDLLQTCSTSGSLCSTHPVESTCCPRRCIPDLEKCYEENPPAYVCTPRTLQPWISRVRKYFGG